jgi:hypothetical protein
LSLENRELSHHAVTTNTYTARALNITGENVYFIIVQLVATGALLVGHLIVIIKNQLARAR